MYIRVLEKEDAALYQELRLMGLQQCPEAFGSDYDREARFSKETVIERLQPVEGQRATVGAFGEDGRLWGIAAAIRMGTMKEQHKADVCRVFVHPEARGGGTARQLMTELIRLAQGWPGVEQLRLAVNAANEPARRLYQALGFQVYGTERESLKWNGVYYDEELMVLRLV
jgi:ribosomal protein S18 acetylase RimI-like enzyme